MPDATLPLAPTPAALRRELEALVIGDRIGPAGGEHEELPGRTRVRDRYLVGMLAPAGTVAVDPERADGAAVNGDTAPVEDSSLDDATAAQPNLFPSSFGLTFVVAARVDAVVVTATWGHYRKEKAEPEGDARGGTVWRRHPASGSTTVSLVAGEVGPVSVDAEQPDVVVRGRAAPTPAGGRLVTLFLVNEQTTPKQNKDEAWLFQAELAVEATDGAVVFIGRDEAIPPITAAGEVGELQLLDMQYRHRVEFAAGHGVAVHADVADGDPARAVRISTAVIPSAVVAATEAPTEADESLSGTVRNSLSQVVLDMEVLAGLTGDALRAGLTPLAGAYEQWLDEQESRLSDPGARLAGHDGAAAVALAQARAMAARLRAGIDVLVADADAEEAFRFANEAMWLQRVHTLAANRRRDGDGVELDAALAQFGAPDRRRT